MPYSLEPAMRPALCVGSSMALVSHMSCPHVLICYCEKPHTREEIIKGLLVASLGEGSHLDRAARRDGGLTEALSLCLAPVQR